MNAAWKTLPLLLLLSFRVEASPIKIARKILKQISYQAPPEEKASGEKQLQPPLPPEKAPQASRREQGPSLERLKEQIPSFFQRNLSKRIYIQVDKPLYRPGETIWIKAWDLKTQNLDSTLANRGFTFELISPKGASVRQLRVRATGSMGESAIDLPAHVQGGEYKIRVRSLQGEQGERPLLVSAFEPPRIKKKLEFIRKAYGAGDRVTAALEIKRPTGEPLKNHPVRAHIRLDGQDLKPISLKSNKAGNAIVAFNLPKEIQTGDALLTILIEDGGVTESISKRIPIILKKLQLSFFPEGGEMVEGLPTRLYFEAKTLLGKPADVEGRIVDDQGQAVARFRSHHQGLGRLNFSPATGRSYHAEISRPVGIAEHYSLPLAKESGCLLKHFDDLDGQLKAIRVGIRCTEDQEVVMVAIQRERLIDAAQLKVSEGKMAVAYLKEKAALQSGVTRLTLLDSDLKPLAERIIFQGRRARLQIELEMDQKSYIPRQSVSVKIKTLSPTGEAIPAALALSVVDDTVVSFADDKTPHMLSSLLLSPELPGKVEEPNFYFDLKEKKAAKALDLLMGARGWRRFDWVKALAPPPPPVSAPVHFEGAALAEAKMPAREPRRRARRAPPKAKPRKVRLKAGRRKPRRAQPQRLVQKAEKQKKAKKQARGPALRQPRAMRPMPERIQAAPMLDGIVADKDWEVAADEPMEMLALEKVKRRRGRGRRARPRWAPIRVFPTPQYKPEYSGPRHDFRDTIYWAPQIQTDAEGQAQIQFPTSDAVTSFRIFSEGVGGGFAGHDEQVFKSNLPFSLSARLPLAVSEGDQLELPITLSNEIKQDLPLQINAHFGELMRLTDLPSRGGERLAAGKRETLYYGMEVIGQRGEAQIDLVAAAGGLRDGLKRSLKVEPLGFPQMAELSGSLEEKAVHRIRLGELTKGSIQASLRLYASPVSDLFSGVEGLLREPHGCFEQTSATHYPNVMAMQYIATQKAPDPALIRKIDRLLDRGYKRLVGFETKRKGYEWFGRSPGHEALSAYGLLEFSDMRGIYAVDEGMIRRTQGWLLSRRDGRGGFKRSSRALDSFGRAAAETTNAYIRWAIASAGLAHRFQREMDAQAKLGASTRDPYLLALAANTLLKLPPQKAAGLAAVKRLVKLQKRDGGWSGAKESITRSGGNNLKIETTALALLALVESGKHMTAVQKAVKWLQSHRGGLGNWGATQATVLTLKALTAYAIKMSRTQSPGDVTLLINGNEVSKMHYEAGRKEALIFENIGKYFQAGENSVELRHKGKGALPYSLAVQYRSVQPANAEEGAVGLSTQLEKGKVRMGESLRLWAVVKNRTDKGQPMTVARIGLPGGLVFQNWQLKELREQGKIAFFETREREVVLYFDALKPKEEKRIPLDLKARIPGRYTGPASSAYLYYSNDAKRWAEGLTVAILR